ncbi:hypothetical protein [Lichenifustis flavocetrariae]|uniref:Uncharacterized protein n=1 Tax=Lichenifustis flavocetrariae TaxID=2949735 RepID=A0AA41Z8N4_9HYPH|nr:hypothetical protein [Lichenifustis flavocetrariae]MCW6512355.1 hypothetical protein [Lichenifustis flavocetrariae]
MTTATTSETATALTVSAAASAPSLTDQIHAIRQVQLTYAGKIGTQCFGFTSKGTAIVVSDLALNTEILAGLDIARGLLEQSVAAAI